jgi:hypothetical protein
VVRIVLVSRTGCHLCDDARVVVDEVARRQGVGWSEVDVDADPELRARYGEEVPVVLVDGERHSALRVDPGALAAALRPRGRGALRWLGRGT